MGNMENQPQYKANNSEQEVTIWEIISALIRNWKPVAAITLGIALIGLIFTLITQNRTDYIFNQKIIYDDYEYYPIDFTSTYVLYLEKYLDDKLGESNGVELTLEESLEGEYYLVINYSNISYDEANEITRGIIDRHNNIMYNELYRLIGIKEEEITLYYNEYKDKQNEYYDFLYSEDGYYNTENDLKRYMGYVDSYKKQLESREKMLLKVQNGFPLLLEEIFLSDGMPIEYYQRDEIIENHYSAESLQKEVEFLGDELTTSQEIYNELSGTFEEMVISEETLKTDRDIAVETWKNRKSELEKLDYDFSRISEYYINDFLLDEESGSSWLSYIVISFIIGFAISIIFVCLKISYLEYNNKNKNSNIENIN